MDEERRTDERVATNYTAKWDSLSGRHDARIEDLSLGGCFVNSLGQVDVGELVSLEINMPSGASLLLRGEVTSYQPAIGFGIRFPFLTDEEEHALRQLLAG